MRNRLIGLFILVNVWLLSACATTGAVGPEPYPNPDVAPTTTPEATPTVNPDMPTPAQAAFLDLAGQIGIANADIKVKTIEKVMWPDSCLGVNVEGMMCLQVITPGYRLVFETARGDFVYHTDESGKNVRLAWPLLIPGATLETDSGIFGQVLIGPNCGGPVTEENAAECDDKPYQAFLAVLDAEGKQLLRFQTDAEGRFRVLMPPGQYTLKPEVGQPLPLAAEQPFSVSAGQFSELVVLYDTGLR